MKKSISEMGMINPITVRGMTARSWRVTIGLVQNLIEVYVPGMKPRLDMTGRITGIGWNH